MAEQLDKQTMVRLAWLTELRRQGHRQCRGVQTGAWTGGDPNTVCAMRLLADMTGREWGDLTQVGSWAGLSKSQVDDVIYMNDGHRFCRPTGRKHTFREIADIVEAWFK